MNMLEVIWSDKKGKSHSKLYSEKAEAEKAYNWLMKNGAADAKIGVHKHEFKTIEETILPDNEPFIKSQATAKFVKKTCDCGETILVDYKVER